MQTGIEKKEGKKRGDKNREKYVETNYTADSFLFFLKMLRVNKDEKKYFFLLLFDFSTVVIGI